MYIASKEFKFEVHAVSSENGKMHSLHSWKEVSFHLFNVKANLFENEKSFHEHEVNIQFCCEEEHARYKNLFSKVEELVNENNISNTTYSLQLETKNKFHNEEDSITLKIIFQCEYSFIIDRINELN